MTLSFRFEMEPVLLDIERRQSDLLERIDRVENHLDAAAQTRKDVEQAEKNTVDSMCHTLNVGERDAGPGPHDPGSRSRFLSALVLRRRNQQGSLQEIAARVAALQVQLRDMEAREQDLQEQANSLRRLRDQRREQHDRRVKARKEERCQEDMPPRPPGGLR